MPLLTPETSSDYSTTSEQHQLHKSNTSNNNNNVKKSVSLFTTLRGLAVNSKKNSSNANNNKEGSAVRGGGGGGGGVSSATNDRSQSQEKREESPNIGKVVSYIFKRTNSMTSANRKKAKNRLVSKLSWKRKAGRNAPHSTLKSSSLKDILDSPVYLPLFRGFLKSEFSEENLDFLMTVRDYRRQPAQPKATEIYETFVRINSPREINIEFTVRKKIELAKTPHGGKIFDEAYERVFKLVESDSFTRFKQSLLEQDAAQQQEPDQ